MFGSDYERAVARRSDPETSWEAAKSVTNIRESQWLVWMTLLGAGPKADFELYPLVLENHKGLFSKPISTSGARTRRSELVKLGMVEFANKFRKNDSGRRTRVWRALSLTEYRTLQNGNPVQADLGL